MYLYRFEDEVLFCRSNSIPTKLECTGESVYYSTSVFMRTDDYTVCPFRRCAGDNGDLLSSPSWWSLPSPLELEISVLLTQAENQRHTGLSVQIWSGKICGKHQWILGLARPASEKVWNKVLLRREPSPQLAPLWSYRNGDAPCLYSSTPESAERTANHAPSASTWTLSPCVWPLVVRKQCSSFPLLSFTLPLMEQLPGKSPPENGDAKVERRAPCAAKVQIVS